VGDAPETPETAGASDPRDRAPDDVPPMLPSRAAYLLVFFSVVLAGVLGGIIGYGIADVGSDDDAARLLGTFVGAMIGATGVGVVAVLVLRAMAEWNRQKR
jgi:lipid-binding SYLF domain-containing protein